ncbi:Holliday junction branch migration protein RuvA [Campylobacter sp.]|uniref:Holliday junction branch migration protein RuvA n=1 Tax=Campylobacter sp. TaxID=205 RepID=UPI0026DAAE8C|nr:Holliday junction branch migration protein RuvA [Campylobacter sp.]MDO4673765.1 Holliday junction branch migration protein RuvA [Campylobacter sp.]
MVVAIEGIITQKEPTFIVLKCQSGVSYGVFVSLFCAAKLEKGRSYELFITPIIKEDSHKFYGFLDREEQKIFEMLLRVNGIGATTAMAVCSSLDTDSFYKALTLGDESLFKKVPGIGAKSAKRILVELEGAKAALSSVSDESASALAALLSLGFKQDKILSVLSSCTAKDTGELVKEALKKLA